MSAVTSLPVGMLFNASAALLVLLGVGIVGAAVEDVGEVGLRSLAVDTWVGRLVAEEVGM